MATKKKTNFISYELKRLDAYMAQLNSYLDDNPPNTVQDRIEIVQTQRGSIIKVIATKEDQIKLFLTTLEKLPKVLSDINDLRKQVEGIKLEEDIRGQQVQPGFMSSKDDEEIEEAEEVDDNDEPDFDSPRKALPASPNKPKSNMKDISGDEFDDESYFNDETE